MWEYRDEPGIWNPGISCKERETIVGEEADLCSFKSSEVLIAATRWLGGSFPL